MSEDWEGMRRWSQEIREKIQEHDIPSPYLEHVEECAYYVSRLAEVEACIRRMEAAVPRLYPGGSPKYLHEDLYSAAECLRRMGVWEYIYYRRSFCGERELPQPVASYTFSQMLFDRTLEKCPECGVRVYQRSDGPPCHECRRRLRARNDIPPMASE